MSMLFAFAIWTFQASAATFGLDVLPPAPTDMSPSWNMREFEEGLGTTIPVPAVLVPILWRRIWSGRFYDENGHVYVRRQGELLLRKCESCGDDYAEYKKQYAKCSTGYLLTEMLLLPVGIPMAIVHGRKAFDAISLAVADFNTRVPSEP